MSEEKNTKWTTYEGAKLFKKVSVSFGSNETYSIYPLGEHNGIHYDYVVENGFTYIKYNENGYSVSTAPGLHYDKHMNLEKALKLLGKK